MKRCTPLKMFTLLPLCLPALVFAATGTDDTSTKQTEQQGLAKYELKPDQARSEGRIYVDPKTGELVAQPVTAKQIAVAEKMTKALQNDKTGLPVRIDPDGMMTIELDERFFDSMHEEVSATGEKHVQCGSAKHDHNTKSLTEAEDSADQNHSAGGQ